MKLSKRIGLMSSVVGLSSLALAGCGASTSTNSVSGSNNASSTNHTANTTSASSKSTGSKTVNIGYDGYFEDVDVTEMWKQLLEKRGWHVKTTQLSVGALFTSLAQGGSSSVNTFMDVWMPHTHKAYMDKYGSKLVNLGVWHKPTRIGLVVPKYVYDQGIHSISDLNAHAKMFNNQIIGITAGAGETLTMKKQVIPGYHLKLKLVDSSGPAMLSALKKAESAHKPIVVTLWSPHWIFGKYQLKYLSDPKNAFGSTGVEQIEANKVWAGKNPTFKKYMSNFKMTKNQLDSLGLLCQQDGKVKGVKTWISKNQSVVNSWFKTS